MKNDKSTRTLVYSLSSSMLYSSVNPSWGWGGETGRELSPLRGFGLLTQDIWTNWLDFQHERLIVRPPFPRSELIDSVPRCSSCRPDTCATLVESRLI